MTCFGRCPKGKLYLRPLAVQTSGAAPHESVKEEMSDALAALGALARRAEGASAHGTRSDDGILGNVSMFALQGTGNPTLRALRRQLALDDAERNPVRFVIAPTTKLSRVGASKFHTLFSSAFITCTTW